MKVHYINVLLIAFPLNILTHNNNKNKSSITPHDTQTNRSLCECELYAPANYDNDPQMKKIMENFNKQTQERFHEYDERMKITRQKCKDRCDKEIQKIILKDKLEKQMEQKLTTLETKIDTDDTPTCICEESLADKTEKFCLNCGYVLGEVAPSLGLLGGMGIYSWLNTSTIAAIEHATKKGIEEGVKTVIARIKVSSIFDIYFNGDWSNFINTSNYSTVSGLVKGVKNAIASTGKSCTNPNNLPVCSAISQGETTFVQYVKAGQEATASTTETIKNAALARLDTTFINSTTIVNASIITILIIVLVMLIIYLILRYRRKKKMKKKLQYIKLLNE
ncbi:rifin PIR protein, putative [Plasmodium reichenowi]|uniref:Rifin PIR protein, putative n=1 Tax=Plasmodium reichenowi TaxID=5854 RepID=A0A2P9DCL7_PLARE|nr:rifin PIR protein, putative [Plasmodium reichenowi]